MNLFKGNLFKTIALATLVLRLYNLKLNVIPNRTISIKEKSEEKNEE